MNIKIATIFAVASISGFACAQTSGIRVFGGYGWSGTISNTTTGSTHLLGPEIGFELPLSHFTSMAEMDFRADVLLGGQLAHGSDLDGYIYRFMLSARTSVPGSQVSTFGAIGYGSGQARNSEFPSFSGVVTQVGIDIPLGMAVPKLAPALELAGSYGRSGLSGYSVCIALHF